MENTIILTTQALTKQYPKCLALNDCTLAIQRGDIVGLVWKNGAGKTTLIRLLTGLTNPTAGSFSIFGSSDPKTIIPLRKRIAAMVETPALYDNMNATANMMTRCLLMDIKNPLKSGYIQHQLEFVGLFGAYTDKRKVKNFSLGMRQRLGIAMAMVGDPELLILDEPTNGLDPEGIRQIRELLLKLNREKGITILVSSHILGELSKFARSYIFIDHGKLIEQISSSELEKRVGKVLILQTSDDEKAMGLLALNKYDVEIVKDSIYVHDVKDAAGVLNLLSSAGLSLKGMREEENSLEDYFVHLVGGN